MRRFQHPLLAGISALLLCGWSLSSRLARADTITSAPSLGISQFKISGTNGQFITLYNLTDTPQDLSRYQLEYFNSYDLSKATTSKLISLSGTVPPHSYFMINDGTQVMCYQLTLESASLGLSNTAGLVELLSINQIAPGGFLQTVVQDYVSWSKVAAAGAQTLPSAANGFLVRQPLDQTRNPQINAPGAGSWLSVQPDNSGCNMISLSGQPIQTGPNQLLPAQEPPATIINPSSVANDQATPAIPPADNGLKAPQLTELLPNPNGTGNDSTDEFIELYNPNAVSFDLSGFQLQTGITTTHRYSFPSGTGLAANGFSSFYSTETRLSLSNTSGKAALIDPLGNMLNQSEAYNNAGDGQAWALADGKWYWTATPTPGAANVIKQAAAVKNSNAKKTAGAQKSVKGSSIKKLTSSASATSQPDSTRPVQVWLLALIGGLALLYGAYEYRHDMANQFYELRRYLSSRRTNRPKVKGRRGD